MAVIAGAVVGPYGEAVEPAGVGGQLEVKYQTSNFRVKLGSVTGPCGE